MKPKTYTIVLVAAVAIAAVGLVFWQHSHRIETPAAAQSTAGKTMYQCSMHPNIVQDHPGKCPICGMDLVPIKKTTGVSIPGRATVELNPQQEQLIGLRVEPARKMEAFKEIRAPGRVEYVEGKLARVSIRTRGWVEKLYADFTGAWVKAGDPLLDIYSPDLLVAQREYVYALQLREKATTPTDKEMAETLVTAATKKLQLLDVPDDQIEELTKTRQPKSNVTLRAPISGYVEHKDIVLKKLVNPDESHFDIVDLSTVWIIADLYENELPLAKVGQEAFVSLVSDPAKKYEGKVNYVYPTLDEKTRTGRVRLEVPNPDLALKPAMYASVELEISLGEQIVVPTEAVFDQGTRQYVFVAKGSGLYEPREITLGPRAHVMIDDKPHEVFVVGKGLSSEERVVVSGNFLLDSESNQRASAGTAPMAGMPGMPGMKNEDMPGIKMDGKEMKH